MDPMTTKLLRGFEYIHEVLPVGSHGVAYEMNVLAQESHLHYLEQQTAIPLYTSAGASTCVLVTLTPIHLPELRKNIKKPINIVGELEEAARL